MSINSINNLANTQPIKDIKNEKINQDKVKNEEANKNSEIIDKFEKSEVKPEATYQKPVFKRDEDMVAKIQAEVDQANANLRNLVEKLLMKQGMTFKDLKVGGPDIKIDDETRLEAQKALDEGGEFSVENVSDRTVNFAKAISGGDKSKIPLLRKAIEKGFEEAEKSFGGKLPDISYETQKRTLEKLDEWENEGNDKNLE